MRMKSLIGIIFLQFCFWSMDAQNCDELLGKLKSLNLSVESLEDLVVKVQEQEDEIEHLHNEVQQLRNGRSALKDENNELKEKFDGYLNHKTGTIQTIDVNATGRITPALNPGSGLNKSIAASYIEIDGDEYWLLKRPLTVGKKIYYNKTRGTLSGMYNGKKYDLPVLSAFDFCALHFGEYTNLLNCYY